jgi:hypothetical protein
MEISPSRQGFSALRRSNSQVTVTSFPHTHLAVLAAAVTPTASSPSKKTCHLLPAVHTAHSLHSSTDTSFLSRSSSTRAHLVLRLLLCTHTHLHPSPRHHPRHNRHRACPTLIHHDQSPQPAHRRMWGSTEIGKHRAPCSSAGRKFKIRPQYHNPTTGIPLCQ